MRFKMPSYVVLIQTQDFICLLSMTLLLISYVGAGAVSLNDLLIMGIFSCVLWQILIEFFSFLRC